MGMESIYLVKLTDGLKSVYVRSDEIVKTVIQHAIGAAVAGAFAVSLAASLALSFIPGIGSLGAGTISALTDFCYVYLAGVIYIQLITQLIKKGQNPSKMSEAELKREAKIAANNIDMKKATKEAKEAFNKYKNDSK